MVQGAHIFFRISHLNAAVTSANKELYKRPDKSQQMVPEQLINIKLK